MERALLLDQARIPPTLLRQRDQQRGAYQRIGGPERLARTESGQFVPALPFQQRSRLGPPPDVGSRSILRHRLEQIRGSRDLDRGLAIGDVVFSRRSPGRSTSADHRLIAASSRRHAPHVAPIRKPHRAVTLWAIPPAHFLQLLGSNRQPLPRDALSNVARCTSGSIHHARRVGECQPCVLRYRQWVRRGDAGEAYEQPDQHLRT